MFHFLLDSDKDNNTNRADPWIPEVFMEPR